MANAARSSQPCVAWHDLPERTLQRLLRATAPRLRELQAALVRLRAQHVKQRRRSGQSRDAGPDRIALFTQAQMHDAARACRGLRAPRRRCGRITRLIRGHAQRATLPARRPGLEFRIFARSRARGTRAFGIAPCNVVAELMRASRVRFHTNSSRTRARAQLPARAPRAHQQRRALGRATQQAPHLRTVRGAAEPDSSAARISFVSLNSRCTQPLSCRDSRLGVALKARHDP